MSSDTLAEIAFFLVSKAANTYVMLLLLRFWMRFCHLDFYNWLSQFIVTITDPPLLLCRRLIPDTGRVDAALLALVMLINIIRYTILFALAGAGVGEVGALLALCAADGFRAFINLLTGLVLLRALLSWFMDSHNTYYQMLVGATEPLLEPARRLLPTLGGADFSPVLVLLLLVVAKSIIAEPLVDFAYDLGPYSLESLEDL